MTMMSILIYDGDGDYHGDDDADDDDDDDDDDNDDDCLWGCWPCACAHACACSRMASILFIIDFHLRHAGLDAKTRVCKG